MTPQGHERETGHENETGMQAYQKTQIDYSPLTKVLLQKLMKLMSSHLNAAIGYQSCVTVAGTQTGPGVRMGTTGNRSTSLISVMVHGKGTERIEVRKTT
jgi:hypothetical protein